MTINLTIPDIREMKPRITVFGVGGAGGNAVNNMIAAGLQGVDFVVANTDAQALTMSKAERIIQMGTQVTEGLGAGSQPEVGRAAAEEVIDEIDEALSELLAILALGLPFALLAAAAAGYFLAGRSLAPVVAITDRRSPRSRCRLPALVCPCAPRPRSATASQCRGREHGSSSVGVSSVHGAGTTSTQSNQAG